MSLLIQYLVKLSISLVIVWLFYHFVLRKLTFYNSNRLYLLGYTFLSFIIPFINISPVLEKNQMTGSGFVQLIPTVYQYTDSIEKTTDHAGPVWLSGFDKWDWAAFILVAGATVLLLRFFLRFLSLKRMQRKASLISTGKIKLYHVDDSIIPFSFGNAVFINSNLHTETELQEIIRHEFVHVKQKHTIDIVFCELLCILNWYNPFAWLLKRSIRQNLEFIADNKVLENGISKKEYQYLLLKVIGNNQYSIASQFNFSSLKKRIAMMNKLKSARLNLVRFLFVLPFVAVMLLAFRANNTRANPKNDFWLTGVVDAGTEMPLKNVMVHESVSGQSTNPNGSVTFAKDTIPLTKKNIPDLPKEILSLNLLDNMEDAGSSDPIKRKLHGLVMVKRKDGEKEMYNIDDKESRNSFEKKYGVKLEDLIPTPPPPPPPPPAAPVKTIAGSGVNLNGISSEYEITDKSAVLKLKDGTIEKYDLTNKEQRASFEKKYGKIINVNANPNVATVITPSGETLVAPVFSQPASTTKADDVSISTVTGVSTQVAIAPVPITTTTGTLVVSPVTPVAIGSEITVIDDYGHVITGNENVIILITKNTTRQQLDDFVKKMKEQNIELKYDEIEYNSKGLLVSISGTMKSKDATSNFVATDFDQLVLAMIKKGDRTYFKVNVKDKEVI